MVNNKALYKIKKTIIEKNISVFLNNSLGETVEFSKFEEASHLCKILNANTDSNCRYEIHKIG